MLAICFHVGFLLRSVFDLEDGGYIFLPNVDFHKKELLSLGFSHPLSEKFFSIKILDV
jgi:hypothetical protein